MSVQAPKHDIDSRSGDFPQFELSEDIILDAMFGRAGKSKQKTSAKKQSGLFGNDPKTQISIKMPGDFESNDSTYNIAVLAPSYQALRQAYTGFGIKQEEFNVTTPNVLESIHRWLDTIISPETTSVSLTLTGTANEVGNFLESLSSDQISFVERNNFDTQEALTNRISLVVPRNK